MSQRVHVCAPKGAASLSGHARRLGVLVACGLAAACASTIDPWDAPLPQDRHPITVSETRSTLQIPVEPDRWQLSYDQKDALEALAAEYLVAGHGPIVIALPVGGGNDNAAVVVGAEARDVLYARGIAYREIRGTAYDAAGRMDAPLVVMVDRYVAEAPECHQRWDDFSRTMSGENTRNFGCAVQANIAAVVTDPADLLGPRGQTPADAGRRATVLDRYRRGETTVTQRSESETTRISDAVE